MFDPLSMLCYIYNWKITVQLTSTILQLCTNLHWSSTLIPSPPKYAYNFLKKNLKKYNISSISSFSQQINAARVERYSFPVETNNEIHVEFSYNTFRFNFHKELCKTMTSYPSQMLENQVKLLPSWVGQSNNWFAPPIWAHRDRCLPFPNHVARSSVDYRKYFIQCFITLALRFDSLV